MFIYTMPISSVNPMFHLLLESSHRDDSNKWSNTGFTEEITPVVSIEVNLIKNPFYIFNFFLTEAVASFASV